VLTKKISNDAETNTALDSAGSNL